MNLFIIFWCFSLSLNLCLSLTAHATEPNWSENTLISSPRQNPYDLNKNDFLVSRNNGLIASLQYPVEISGMLIPFRPMVTLLDQPILNPFKSFMTKIFKGISNIHHTDDLFKKMGLQSFPLTEQTYPFDLPKMEHHENTRMGVTLLKKDNIELMTLSCAACHVGNLFGKKIIGMTNRFPRSNEIFVLGKKGAALLSPSLFKNALGANETETLYYRNFRNHTKAIGAKMPVQLGLDTSLAQVALSLSHRNKDEVASFNPEYEKKPRHDLLENLVSDSKPAVWWNLKYKNKWLSDGSVVSGNPVYTNFIWNEIGRGSNLVELSEWLKNNSQIIQDLTTAVFSSEAPRYTDFFPANRINLNAAKRGQILYKNKCEDCHGIYEKTWDLENADRLPLFEQLKTTRVLYPENTKVIDVGTDRGRYTGMKSLEISLNPLQLSKENKIVIRSQKGYVPPPLVGIWSRWPYFHNNSAPTLCAVLSPENERPITYYAGEAIQPETDFDEECNGYPNGAVVPLNWKKEEFRFDTKKEGLKNTGHNVGIRNQKDRLDLIQFLKTL